MFKLAVSMMLCALTLTGLLPQKAGAQCTAPAPVTVPDAGNSHNLGPVSSNIVAQTFIAPGSGGCLQVQSVAFWAKSSNPQGNLVVSIYGVDALEAPAAQIGSSVSITQFASAVYVSKTATFDTPVTITGGQQYAVVFAQPATTTGSERYDIEALQNNDGGYPSGKVWSRLAAGGAWTSQQNRDVLMTVTFSCCPTGCTHSQGYWKNHYPALWPEFATLNLGAVSYSPDQLHSILRLSVGGNRPGDDNGGNGLISLAHQLIAAKLNILNGAPGGAIAATIVACDALIGDQNVLGAGYLAPNAISPYVDVLDRYNNGVLEAGPPKCLED